MFEGRRGHRRDHEQKAVPSRQLREAHRETPAESHSLWATDGWPCTSLFSTVFSYSHCIPSAFSVLLVSLWHPVCTLSVPLAHSGPLNVPLALSVSPSPLSCCPEGPPQRVRWHPGSCFTKGRTSGGCEMDTPSICQHLHCSVAPVDGP